MLTLSTCFLYFNYTINKCMKISQNKFNPNKTKFTNWIKGKSDNNFYYLLPTIVVSPKKNLHWDMTIKTFFFGFLNYYAQYNVCEIVKDNSSEFTKEVYGKLEAGLRLSNLKIIDQKACLEYMKNATFLTQILRNSTIEHPYVRKVLYLYLSQQSFVAQTSN